MLVLDHREKSARTDIIVNNITKLVAKWRSFGAKYQTLTIITQAPLVRAYSDGEEQNG